MTFLVLFSLISLILCVIGWLRYFQERKKYLVAQTLLVELQKISTDWQKKTAVWEESTKVWKEVAKTWQKTAETYQRSADVWRDLYLETEENNEEEEFIN
ncbi:MAG: hypothetical protein HY819_10995 [Acidobacteria bacterium]|nr:hypothetical protein [Acidobacteriota bacterium]